MAGRRYCSWGTEVESSRIEGGFALVHGRTLLKLWQDRHTDIPRSFSGLWGVRVYLAMVEMSCRRQGRAGRFGPMEVCGLLKVSPTERNLCKARQTIDHILAVKAITQQAGAWRSADVGSSPLAIQVKRSSRRVPIPRRILRIMTATNTAAQLGAMIAMCLRCLHNHVEQIRSAGRLCVTWVAELFGLDRSAVGRCLKKLDDQGIIKRLPTPQYELNRFGMRVQVQCQPPSTATAESSAQNTQNQRPCLNQHPLRYTPRDKYQHPGAGPVPAGVLRPATMKNVLPQDLSDLERLAQLFSQTQGGRGGATPDNRRWVEFLGMAERARDHGSNTVRLFVWLVRQQKGKWVTCDQEDRGHARAKKWTWGVDRHRKPEESTKPARIVTKLTNDQQIRKTVEIVARRTGLPPLVVLKKQWPHWTRSRWESAYSAY